MESQLVLGRHRRGKRRGTRQELNLTSSLRTEDWKMKKKETVICNLLSNLFLGSINYYALRLQLVICRFKCFKSSSNFPLPVRVNFTQFVIFLFVWLLMFILNVLFHFWQEPYFERAMIYFTLKMFNLISLILWDLKKVSHISKHIWGSIS